MSIIERIKKARAVREEKKEKRKAEKAKQPKKAIGKIAATVVIGGGLAIATAGGYAVGKSVGANKVIKKKVQQKETSTAKPAYEDCNSTLEERVEALQEAVKKGDLRVEKEDGSFKYFDKQNRVVAVHGGVSKKNEQIQNATFYVYDNPRVPLVQNGVFLEVEAKDGIMREDNYHFHDGKTFREMKLYDEKGESFAWTHLQEETEVPQFREGYDADYAKNVNLPYSAQYPAGKHLLGGGIIKTGRD